MSTEKKIMIDLKILNDLYVSKGFTEEEISKLQPLGAFLSNSISYEEGVKFTDKLEKFKSELLSAYPDTNIMFETLTLDDVKQLLSVDK